MACPNIKFGISSGGATEYNVSSGREIFRCGDCVKAYVTNVSIDKVNVTIGCDDPSDANENQFCMISANGNIRDRYVINWGAKDNVTTALDNGYVITRVGGNCTGANEKIFIYADGNISARAYANVEDADTIGPQILDKAKQKLGNPYNTFDFSLSDININVSPTDWQTMGISGFGIKNTPVGGIRRKSFSWNNGRVEEGQGDVIYDTTATPQPLGNVITTLINS